MDKRDMFERLSKLDPKLVKTLTKEYARGGVKKQFSVKYITARTVMNMLDSIVGPENWRAEYQPLTDKVMACTLFLRIEGEWIGKTDVGTPSDIEPEKGAVSDAFKRAAVHWGIGRELYNEGTATFEDSDEPEAPAQKTTPALIEPPSEEMSDSDLAMLTWTRDKALVVRMVSKAEDFWKIGGSHLYNRIARALVLPPGDYKKRELLVQAVAEHYTRTPQDAWKSIEAYEVEAPAQV